MNPSVFHSFTQRTFALLFDLCMLFLITLVLYFKLSFFSIHSANNKIVALKEIRLQEEEGAPFTAIREGVNFSFQMQLLQFHYSFQARKMTLSLARVFIVTFQCHWVDKTKNINMERNQDQVLQNSL